MTFANPQSWNKYAYVLNNPLSYVDRNGLWPTWIHSQIVREAFPGLSDLQIRTLQDASRDTDWGYYINGRSPQDPSSSFIHGMTDGVNGQNPADAPRLGDSYVSEQEQIARDIQTQFQLSGESVLHLDALTQFGRSMHTIQDRTSPAHEGNQRWMGTAGRKSKILAAKHFNQERTIGQQRMQMAVQATRDAFRRTFGDQWYWIAIGQPPPKKEKVTTTIRFEEER